MVQIALACAKEHVIYIWPDGLSKTAIALDTQFHIGTVIAHHIHQGVGQFIPVFFIHPSLHRLHYLGIHKAVDVVPAFSIATIRREKTLVKQSFKGHAKVISLRVERIAGMLYRPSACQCVGYCNEYIQSAHTGMPVRREVEVAVGSEGGKHLIALGIDGTPQVLHSPQSVTARTHTPQVQSANAAGHITHKVEPLPVGRNGRMGIA